MLVEYWTIHSSYEVVPINDRAYTTGQLVTTEKLSQCLLGALPENADVALVYIILIKHHRSLSISCVLTMSTT